MNYLVQSNAQVWVRVPMIPELVANEKNLTQIRQFLSKYKRKIDVSFLPFHKMAKSKYENYGIEYRMEDIKEIPDEMMISYYKLFKNDGFNINIE